MAKISGFTGDFNGLSNSEAWQRVYEFGRNCIPVKEKRIKKAYMKIFKPNTKVIRDGAIQKVKTEYLVPGDNIIVESGQFIPVDGKILAQNNFEVINNRDGQVNQFVYQGSKVICGKAIIEAMQTSDITFTGEIIKKIDGYNIKKNRFARKIKKWGIGFAIVTVILAIFAFIFAFVTVQAGLGEKILQSLSSALVMLLFGIPVGFISAFAACLSRQCKKLKESGLKVKRLFSLPEAEKVTMICLEDSFLGGEYTRKISRLYEVGITIIVLTEKRIDDVREKIEKAGICNGEIAYITKNELLELEDDEFRKVICDNFVFCELDQQMKDRIILTFEALGVRCLTSGYGLDSVLSIENADIGISKNHDKGSLDYELADATLYNDNFDAFYEMIRQSFICSCCLKTYIYHAVVFQFPILLFILIMLLNKINIGELWSQGVLLIFAIIPSAMFLVDKDYSNSRLIDLKEHKEKFPVKFISCIFIAIAIVVFLLLEGFGLMRIFYMDAIVSMNISFMTLAVMIITAGVIEKAKFPYKGKIALRNSGIKTQDVMKEDKFKEVIVESKSKKEAKPEKEVKTNAVKEKTEKEVKKKPVKEKPAKKKDIDLGNETL